METLALYDRHGEPLGLTLERRNGEAPRPPEGAYTWCCDIWLVNSHGEILIQRRSLSKSNWPGAWYESAGGSIQADETNEEGCKRETLEEIGVELDMNRGNLAFVYTGKTAHHDVWIFQMDVPVASLVFQPEEVIDAKYVTPDKLRRMVLDGEFVPCGYLEQLLQTLPILLSAYGKEDA